MTRKINLLILLAGIIIGSFCVPCASAAGTVSTTHPYMLFHDISQVPGYQNQAQDPWKTWQNQIVIPSDTYLGYNFAGDMGAYNRVGYRAQFAQYLGLSYQITKKPAYAQKAKEALLNLSIGNVTGKVDHAVALGGYSLAYDWIQPTLDPATDRKIRDNLATLADTVYKDLNDNGTTQNYVTFADYHGQAYPNVGIAAAALSDYTNPNHLPLSSTPADWYRVGTDYLFVNDALHTTGKSMLSAGFDEADGKHLLGAYKQYVMDDFCLWINVASHSYNINLLDQYPAAKKAFTEEEWDSLPNGFSGNFVTNGNTGWIYQKALLGLLPDSDKGPVLRHIEQVESSTILPDKYIVGGAPNGGVSTPLLYCVYGDYSSIPRVSPSATSHLSTDGLYQVFRGSWNEDADWLALTTWNVADASNRNMLHNDQLGFEYYSRGDLLLADAGEPKHLLGGGNYGTFDIDHNTIALENPRTPFTLSPWSGSTSAGIYKGNAVGLVTPSTVDAVVQAPWIQLLKSHVTISKVMSGASGTTQALSSPVGYERTVLYPESDYFIIVDRLQGTETWGYRNIFRPSSLMITPTTAPDSASTIGHVNLNLNIGSTPYNWQALTQQVETNTGITANSLSWTTTNPYGQAVTANLVTSPSSRVLVEKNTGRIGGYETASEVFSPVVYFQSAPSLSNYRVTALLSSYASETPKTGTELAVTGTGHALNVHAPAYDDYLYTGTGTSVFGPFTTDADTAYARNAGGVVTGFTILEGSSLSQAGVPVVSLSRKADYFTAKRTGNTIKFRISAPASTDVVLSGVAASSVTRDGSPYTSWALQTTANTVKITADPGTHEFVVSSGNFLDLSAIAPVSVAPGKLVTFPVNATYTGKGTVTYSAGSLPVNATFSTGARVFAWTPVASQVGTYNVTFSATDGTLSAATFAIITVSDANLPPVISAVPVQSVTAGNALAFTVTATDPNGNIPTCSASGLPSGSTFNARTRTFAWTPAAAQTGTYTVTFTASDGSLSASTVATIAVVASPGQTPAKTPVPTTGKTPVPTTVKTPAPAPVKTPVPTGTMISARNLAPVIDPIPPQTVVPGTRLWFTVKASDPNGNALTYSASNLPSRAVFRPDSQDFVWVPVSSQAGTYTVLFSASDGSLTSNTKVTIVVTPGNRAPVFTAIPDQTVKAGTALAFTVTASDPGGKTLAYSADNLPQGSTFNASTCTFAWTPAIRQLGTYRVTFTANDGSLSSSTTATITVTDQGQTGIIPRPGWFWHPWNPWQGY